MKLNRMIFVLVAIAAVAVAIAPTLVKASTEEGPAVAQDATGVQEPSPTNIAPPERGCRVSRNCAYPPPSSISCSSLFVYGCSEGADGYGWVECDGVRTYCSGPSCSGNGTPCLKDTDCSPTGACTCGEGFCSNGYCYCPTEPLS